MDIIALFEEHSLRRLAYRAAAFGLYFEEAKTRAVETAKLQRVSCRHKSKKHSTYCKYFNDGLTFYVICEEVSGKDCILLVIKTVIIKKGR